jgi:hypothetical protein
MRYEEKYCIWSGSSIGGFPLEEASEHERIPSIIGSIVWSPSFSGYNLREAPTPQFSGYNQKEATTP